MKRQLIIYAGLFPAITSCAVFNADLRYKPKSADEYYFPSLSAELCELIMNAYKE